MERSKKKAVAPQAYKNKQSLKGELATYNKSALGTYKNPYIKKANTKSKTSGQKQASERFRMITERAQSIRDKHPKMKWKNAIKKASKELF